MSQSDSTLSENHCEACRVGAPKVTTEEARELLQEIPQWRMDTVDGTPQLRRQFTFENFAKALAFTNQVGALAEEEGHHPALLTEWGSVEVAWWTHKIKGLHKNDFIMAAKTDRLFQQMQ